ncbi:hypothetical protein GCM10022393_33620 [Aquimarina addita]|uniref:DUF4837 family protein n=1 Tax=Aquimarina addita TaxID=870485 RepID=A0ABP6UQB8_9FLAO
MSFFWSRKVLIIILIEFIFFSCSNKTRDKFPEKIITTKTANHIGIKGTKIFAEIPPNFYYIKNLSKYQSDNGIQIQFIESNAFDFNKAKLKITHQVLKSNGTELEILENVKFNNFEGIFGEGYTPKKKERKILFLFGDDDFAVAAIGVYPEKSRTNRNEVLKIFKTLFYEKESDLKQFELSNFEFDQSITNFKYAFTTSNMFVFNEEGKADIDDPFANSIMFLTLPKMKVDEGFSFLKNLLANAENTGYKLNSPELAEFKIGKYSAIILESEQQLNNKNGIIYAVVLIGESSSVAFIGNSFTNNNELLEKYKKTVESIKLTSKD